MIDIEVMKNNMPDLSQAVVSEQEIRLPNPESIITQSELIDFNFDYHLPSEAYHSRIDYLSASGLREAVTPFHYKLSKDKPRETTKAMEKGTAYHTMFLEPEKFEYFVFDDSAKFEEMVKSGANPEGVRRTKEYKAWKESELAKNVSNAPVIDKELFSVLFAAHKRVKKDMLIKTIMKHAVKEASVFCTFENNLKVKIRPDALLQANDNMEFDGYKINTGDIVCISLKTTRSAHPEAFRKLAVNMEYHVSEAFYHDILTKVHKGKKVHVIIVACEENGLFMIYPLSVDFINFGRTEYNKRLNKLLEAISANNFDEGYESLNSGSNIAILDAPYWANTDLN